MLGAMVGIREGTHFVVDLWPPLNARAQAAIRLVASVFVLVFAFVFLWWGIDFTRFALNRISELAELPLWYIHLPWPLAGVTWILFLGEQMWDDLRIAAAKRRQIEGRPTNLGASRERRDRPRPGHREHHHVRGVLRAARAARAGGVSRSASPACRSS